MNFHMFKLVLEKAEEPEIKLPTSAGSSKKQESSKKHLFLLYWLCQSLWLGGSQQTVENSERDETTRPPDLPLEKRVCRSGNNSYNWTWNNGLVPNRKGIYQGCILSLCLFNLYAEYIMRNAGLDEAQAAIKIPRKITITSDMQMTRPLWQKVKNKRASLWKWKRRLKIFA